jgi:uncharacterized protein YraI
MKKLKKYISVLAAVFMLAAYTSVTVYAEPAVIGEEIEDAEEEDPDEIIPIETDSDDPDDEDIEFVDPEEPPDAVPEDTTAPADTPAETTQFETPSYNATDAHTMYATDVINVRYGPDTSYSKFGTIYSGAPVTVIGYSGGWLAIQYNGSTGFVSASFFSDSAPETTAATTAAPTQAAQDTTEPEETGAAEIEETTPAVTEPPVETTKKTQAPETTKETEDTTKSEDEEAAAAVTDPDNKSGGLGGLLIAVGCAVGTFLLIGVIPVLIHSIYHKKLYQY